MSTNFS